MCERELEWAQITLRTHFLCQAHARAQTSFGLTLVWPCVRKDARGDLSAALSMSHTVVFALYQKWIRRYCDMAFMFTECYKRSQLGGKNSPAHHELILGNRSGLMALQLCRQRSLTAMRLNKKEVLHLWAEGGVSDRLHARLVEKLQVCDPHSRIKTARKYQQKLKQMKRKSIKELKNMAGIKTRMRAWTRALNNWPGWDKLATGGGQDWQADQREPPVGRAGYLTHEDSRI